MSSALRNVLVAGVAFSLGCVAQSFTEPQPSDPNGFEVIRKGKEVRLKPKSPDDVLLVFGEIEESDDGFISLRQDQTFVVGQRYTLSGPDLLPCIPPYPSRLLGCTPVPPPPPGVVCLGGERDAPPICFPGKLLRTLGPRSGGAGVAPNGVADLPRPVGGSVSPRGGSYK